MLILILLALALATIALTLRIGGDRLLAFQASPARHIQEAGWQARATAELLQMPARQLDSRVHELIMLLSIPAAVLPAIAIAPLATTGPARLALAMCCVAIATAIMALLAEALPRWLQSRDATSLAAAPAVWIFLRLGTPLQLLVDRCVSLLLRPFGIDSGGTHLNELDEFALDPVGRHLLQRVLRLGERSAESLMTPRTRIVWLDAEAGVAENLATMRTTPYSRYPVFRLDAKDEREILGMLEVKRLAGRPDLAGSASLFDDLRAPLYVPSSARAMDLLDEFRDAQMPLALVVDEYGDIEGMVSVNDVLTAVIGRAAVTLNQSREQQIISNEDGTWLIDGSVAVDDLRELLELDRLPNEDAHDFNTVSGMMTAQFGRIPRVGEHFAWGALRFQVIALDGARIDKVHVERLPPDPA